MATLHYITSADLVQRYGEDQVLTLADEERTDDIASPSVVLRIERAIEGAEGEVNGYVSRRYDVPVISVPLPRQLVDIVIDVTMWKLCRGPTQEDDGLRMRYKDARKTLEGIASGTISLGIPDPDAGGGNFVTTTGIATADRERAKKNLDQIF